MAKLRNYNWRVIIGPVIGVDEAGRGCLAGPVYAGAVIVPIDLKIPGLTDSKLLNSEKRSELFEVIQEKCLWSYGIASAQEIERINILQASLLAMKRAVEGLQREAQLVLVDGKFKIPGVQYPQEALIKGELRAMPIAAASIVAKVMRDRRLVELAQQYPEYGFEIHKGYATELHRQKIAEHGPCAEHRVTFAGVREHVRPTPAASPAL